MFESTRSIFSGSAGGPSPPHFRRRRSVVVLAVIVCLWALWGCAVKPLKLQIEGSDATFEANAIVSAQTGRVVDFQTLVDDLSSVDVVYVGEKHTDPDHHLIQLKIVQALFEKNPDLMVGMEMFDRSYQATLDLWSAGKLDAAAFLEKSHWYANWKFDFALYRDLLAFVQAKRIRLVGLNLPFHISPKIAVGGIENLSEEDRKHVAEHIDTTHPEHRAYIKAVFGHHKMRGRENFEYFYAAQCAWEDTMAETIAATLSGDRRKMVVLAGNGHITRKFGIPDRAGQRSKRSFKTVYPVSIGERIQLDVADYIWVTPRPDR